MKSHFQFNKQERRGIFFLLLLIGGIQAVYFMYTQNSKSTEPSKIKIDAGTNAYIDSLKLLQTNTNDQLIYPFNPNFISDYKGYMLGMSAQEIDRLHAFREEDKYVRSAKEFQEVTLISNSLLDKLLPYFKFPEFTTIRSNTRPAGKERMVVVDLNSATEEELRSISGIGEVLAGRIVNFRKSLGGFLVAEQLFDVYGLEPDVAKRAMKKFKVLEKPVVTKININTASIEELSSLVYINRNLAEGIVAYRNEVGKFDSIPQLTKIEDFPTKKIHRIALYLAL